MTTKEFFIKILGDLFVISSLLFLFLVAAESIKRGFATNYLNMNYVLIVVVFVGMVYAIINKSKKYD